MRVLSIPMRTRFRGITTREVVLLAEIPLLPNGKPDRMALRGLA